MRTDFLQVAESIAERYAELPQVKAIAISGSQTTDKSDEDSDLDLYVYMQPEIPVIMRAQIAKARSSYCEVDNRFWEPGDEWLERGSMIAADVVFRTVPWIEKKLSTVLVEHEAMLGYTTCLWHNVLFSRALYDRDGWFAQLQEFAGCPFPEELRKAIIAKNYPVLRRNQSSYLHQLGRAASRKDLVSINHRIAALLASYFDILFAINRIPHPGEKRIVQFVKSTCRKIPPNMEDTLEKIMGSIAIADRILLEHVGSLIGALEDLLRSEQLI